MDIMNWLLNLLANPNFQLVLKWFVRYWLFMAMVSALPMPKPNGSAWSRGYQFIFALLHGFSANVARAFYALKIPGAQDPDAAAAQSRAAGL